jgi:hypothetical protein
MSGRALLALLLLSAAASAPAAQAQDPVHDALFLFDLSTPAGNRADVPINGLVNLPVTFHDRSRDGTSLVPAPGVPPTSVVFHQVTWEVIPAVNDPGWTVFPPSAIFSQPGTETTVDVPFQVTPQASSPFYPIELVAHITVPDGTQYTQNVTLLGFSLGANSFAAQVTSSYEIRPRQVIDVPVRLTNLALETRGFDMEVVDNACGLPVATQSNNLVPGKSQADYTVSIQGPEGKLYYFSDSCSVSVAVSPSGRGDIVQTAVISLQVSGGYVNPVWVFNTLGLLLVLLLLFLVLARRKARIEEEILGKPQKPWTIPVEALYLKALRQKDERAWYVVRHYLMEDEYRSALLWYKAYKKSTKGDRKKERLVVVQEKAYDRWKAAWRRDIDRPIRKADRREAQLQRKLDRKARKAHRRQMAKYRKLRRKLEAAHAKQVERAGKRHAKEAARAARKGLPAPKRPVVAEPDYPDEPQPVPIPLAGHRWSRKAARYRARMVRRQGDLEVRFEKADARRLRKVRRKVHKLARKLDDPEFVKEHPLLQ